MFISSSALHLIAERLASVTADTSFKVFGLTRRRIEPSLPISTLMASMFIYCTDVAGLLAVGLPAYHSRDWRLFGDSSERSLKCVLLHTGSKYGSIPVGHSVVLKENYSNIKVVLESRQLGRVVCSVDLRRP